MMLLLGYFDTEELIRVVIVAYSFEIYWLLTQLIPAYFMHATRHTKRWMFICKRGGIIHFTCGLSPDDR